MSRAGGQTKSDIAALDAQAQEVERKALALRKAGASYRAIGDQLKHPDGTSYSQEGARKAVARGMDRLRAECLEEAAEVKDMELQRLDGMFLAIWDRAQHGEAKAIETALKIMEQRAKLLGLYAPTKVEHGGELTLTDERALNEEILALAVEVGQMMERGGVAGDLHAEGGTTHAAE